MGKAFTIIGKIIVTLIFTGMLGFGALLALLMVFPPCGDFNPGALIVIIPIALVVVPLYFKILINIWRNWGKKKNPDTPQIKMTKEEIALVKYIIDARGDGTSDSEIRSQFLTAGWSGDEIDRAFGLTPPLPLSPNHESKNTQPFRSYVG